MSKFKSGTKAPALKHINKVGSTRPQYDNTVTVKVVSNALSKWNLWVVNVWHAFHKNENWKIVVNTSCTEAAYEWPRFLGSYQENR